MIIPESKRLKNIGEYYFSTKLEEIRKLKLQGRDIINLGIGSPDLMPSQLTIDAAVVALKASSSHGYASYKGSPELRKSMSDWYQNTFKINLDFEKNILPLLGSKEGVLYTTMAFVNPGDKVLIPDPGYPAYTSAAYLAGAKPIFYNLVDTNDFLPNLKALEKMNLRGTKIMWVNYPHMPTGRAANPDTFKSLVAFAKRRKILLVNDNPYSLVLNKKPLSLLQFDPELKVSLELNSLSKAFNMAGWRVGMLCGHPDYIEAVMKVKSNVDTGIFLPVQAGAIEAFRNPLVWHEERNAVYARRQKIAYKIMQALGFEARPNQVGMFIWGKAPTSIKDVNRFVDFVIEKADVFITPGFIFGKNGKSFCRVSLCANEERLTEALHRVSTRIKVMK